MAGDHLKKNKQPVNQILVREYGSSGLGGCMVMGMMMDIQEQVFHMGRQYTSNISN